MRGVPFVERGSDSGSEGIRYQEIGVSQFGFLDTAELHFGIGEAEEIDEIVVTWPNSSKDQRVIPSPEINQRLVIQQ